MPLFPKENPWSFLAVASFSALLMREMWTGATDSHCSVTNLTAIKCSVTVSLQQMIPAPCIQKGVLLQENNQWRGWVMKRSHSFHAEDDYFSIRANPKVFYSFYTTAIWDPLHAE